MNTTTVSRLRPWLVQRVLFTEPLAFPAGFRDRYIASDKLTEAVDKEAINHNFPLDYMGSAEFEFGGFGVGMRAFFRKPLVRTVLTAEGSPKDYTSNKKVPVISTASFTLYSTRDMADKVQEIWPELSSDSLRMQENPCIRDAFGTYQVECSRTPSNRLKRTSVFRECRYMAWFDFDNHWLLVLNTPENAAWMTNLEAALNISA